MFAVLHLPGFPLQAALRHEPELRRQPLALVDPALSTPRVVDQTPAAHAAGVVPGLTTPQALARCRDVRIRHRSPAPEATATGAVLQVAAGFSPFLEHTAPGTFTLDLRGLAEWRGEGEAGPEAAREARQRWAARLQAAVARLDLEARVGVGPTPNTARHAALWPAPGGVTLVDDPRAFLAALPVEALDPTPHVRDILAQWGVRTVGEFLALGQAEVTDRLGLEALGLFAAASTRATRPLELVRPGERFEEVQELEAGIETLEPVLFLLRRFVDALGRRLELAGLAAEQLTLGLRLETGEVLERRLRVPEPTTRAEVLFRMLHTHLETVRTAAPVIGLHLLASPTRPVRRQLQLFEASLGDPHQFEETLARLGALVGADRVGSPRREDSHRPGAFRMEPPDFENAPGVGEPRTPALLRPTPWRRLRPAAPAAVTTAGDPAQPEGLAPPATVSSPAVRGRLRITAGPWRSSGNWWEAGQAWQEEEWDAATTGGTVVRLVRRGGEWTVDGLLD